MTVLSPLFVRFLRELGQLKCNSNSGDKELYDWLKSLGPEYPQYTHNLMHCGIDIQLLPFVTDIHLKDDGGITNGVHRMKILKAIHPWGKSGLLLQKSFNPTSKMVLWHLRVDDREPFSNFECYSRH